MERETGGFFMQISNEESSCHFIRRLGRGWMAGKIVRGTGFAIIGDILVGIAGALVAKLYVPKLGFHIGTGIISETLFGDRRHLDPDDRAAGQKPAAGLTLPRSIPAGATLRNEALTPMGTATASCRAHSGARLIAPFPAGNGPRFLAPQLFRRPLEVPPAFRLTRTS